MKTFEYTIKDELGIHARPAGALVKEAKKFTSGITVSKNGKEVEATKLMAIMGLGIKCNDTVKITITGEDEEAAYSSLKEFFNKAL